ncbi:Hypothetical protein NTJ_02653 [Nesidiocoris tenuis]|uniref:Uncharacterized protein n=2 Tax=Nesidiocoris tenuis TaxID=355587 RepID=A0ABN7AC16_9HEMI|nr:Hypothetical protein NTJ_02653 [Nesidiocoris tenuis]
MILLHLEVPGGAAAAPPQHFFLLTVVQFQLIRLLIWRVRFPVASCVRHEYASMTAVGLLVFTIASIAKALPLCPCPEEKWQPPFKPSQMVYSEFPEDRGRSMNLFSRRKDAPSRQRISHPQKPPHIPKDGIGFGNRLTVDYDDPPSRGHSSGTDYVDHPSDQYTDKDYDQRLRGNQNYLDYDDGASSSHEGAEKQKDYSLENSAEYVDQYNNRFNDDYKDKKSKEDDNVEPNFTLEDFELDPEVMNPPPPLSTRPLKKAKGTGPSEDGAGGKHDEVHEPTIAERPERPQINHQGYQPHEPVQHHQIEATSPPLIGSSMQQVFQNPPLIQMTPSQPGWGRWKNVLAQTETSNLQVMKPPPLGQAQTWGRIINNKFLSSPYDTGNREVQYPKRILVPQLPHNQVEHHPLQQYHYSKNRGLRGY